MDNEKKRFKSFHNTHTKNKYILTDYFGEIVNKNKKNLLPNQIQKYLTAIDKGIDSLRREELLDGFYNKFLIEYYNQNKNLNNNKINHKKEIEEFPKIKSLNKKSIIKSNEKYDINKQNKTNYNINIKIKNNKNSNNNNNNFLNKTFNINQIKLNENHIIMNLENDKKNKYRMSRQSFFYPFATISSSEEKNLYIKNHNLNQNINNITEEGKAIEKKLVKNDKKKYFSGFKSRYKNLMKKDKRNIVNMNEYISGKGGNKNNLQKNLLNKYKIVKIQSVLNQINRKIKKINHKEKMKNIIEDVKQFQLKEKDLRDKFNRTDEKFNNLLLDSNIIRKRIIKKFNQYNN